jgi:tetratricopeptide (TPR) repeat protein
MYKILLIALLGSCLSGCPSIPTQEEFPNDIDYANGEQSFLAGNYTSAITRYDSFMIKHASSKYASEALYRIGLSYFSLGQYDKAKDVLNQSLQKKPHLELQSEIYSALARICMFQRDYPYAVTYYKKALSIHKIELPQDEIMFNLATALIRSGKWDEGYSYFKKLISQYPNGYLTEIAIERLYLPPRIFIVQLGKYEIKDNAIEALNLLQNEKDIKVSLKTMLIGDTEVYFLWIGNFSSWPDAFKKAEEIQSKGVEAIVIP